MSFLDNKSKELSLNSKYIFLVIAHLKVFQFKDSPKSFTTTNCGFRHRWGWLVTLLSNNEIIILILQDKHQLTSYYGYSALQRLVRARRVDKESGRWPKGKKFLMVMNISFRNDNEQWFVLKYRSVRNKCSFSWKEAHIERRAQTLSLDFRFPLTLWEKRGKLIAKTHIFRWTEWGM